MEGRTERKWGGGGSCSSAKLLYSDAAFLLPAIRREARSFSDSTLSCPRLEVSVLRGESWRQVGARPGTRPCVRVRDQERDRDLLGVDRFGGDRFGGDLRVTGVLLRGRRGEAESPLLESLSLRLRPDRLPCLRS